MTYCPWQFMVSLSATTVLEFYPTHDVFQTSRHWSCLQSQKTSRLISSTVKKLEGKKYLKKTRTISTNHRLSFPGWTRTLSMKQSNPSITKVFFVNNFFVPGTILRHDIFFAFVINFSSVDAWQTQRAPLERPPANISLVFQQISTATGRLIAGSVIFYHIITLESIIHPSSNGKIDCG